MESHIHSFLAVNPPFLGAPKALRTVLVGGTFGLEMFLTSAEMRFINRSCASIGALFPGNEEMYPDEMV